VARTGLPACHVCWANLTPNGRPDFACYARVLLPIHTQEQTFVLSACDRLPSFSMRPDVVSA